MFRRQRGFTLVEIALAVAIGLSVMAAAAAMFGSVQRGAKFSQAKSMVGTIQTNVAMDKFRQGSPPPFSALFANRDSSGKPFYSNTTALPPDPISGYNGVLYYNSQATPIPLAAGDPNTVWDLPVFSSAQPSPTPPVGFAPPVGSQQPPRYGRGGWLYDPATGAFRANLSNKDYSDQRPGAW
jgi:prepilin-type N-terminal cleavage/methylation domain-containing protein